MPEPQTGSAAREAIPAALDGGSEQEWIRLARQGDLAAFDQLVHRYRARIHATVYHMTSSREDADDLTQEAFLKAFRSLSSFKGNSSFYTWIYRIAVNKTINFLKRSRRRKTQMSLYDIDPEGDARLLLPSSVSEDSPRRQLHLWELQRRLNEAMQKLSNTHRLAVTLHDIQGLPHEEIGRIMGCSTGTVRSRLFYARQQLQAHLSDYLG